MKKEKKTVKAWAVLNKNGGITASATLDIHLEKDRAEAMVIMRDPGIVVVSVKITYEILNPTTT